MVLKQLRYRNSFPIKRGTLPVSENAFCACKAASATGTNWECKGRLVSAWEKDRKVVVTRREGLTLAECDCEFSKREFAEDVIGSSAERLRRCVQLVPMFCAQFSGQGEAETDECVLIRDRVEGAEQELLRVWEGGSRNPHPHPIILSLAKASCRHSRGQAVISSVKGVMKTSHDNEQCHVTYHVTSLAVQSVKKEYGASDRGVQGQIFIKKFTYLFVTKRCDRDDRWNFFKGRIISKHQTARKILVKSIRDNKSLSSTECHAELLEFVRAAYRFSNGRYVISGVKGFKRGDSGSAAYFLTSVTVHSVGKEFGVTDKGQDGVTAFLSCGGLQNTDIPRNISSTASG
nr:hypothetical protein BaRGS_003807 [Batillaria attramentaria]